MPPIIIHPSHQIPQPSRNRSGQLHRSQKLLDPVKQDLVSSASAHGNATKLNTETDRSKQQSLSLSGSCSPQAGCQFCEFIETSHWESGSDDDCSAAQSVSPCALCATEPAKSKPCQLACEVRNVPQPPVCIDPACLENLCEDCAEDVCEECSDHGGSCEECVVQCGSDCGISLNGDGPICRDRDDHQFDESYSELFGDQAAQMFDFDGRLPQLPLNSTPPEFGDSALYRDDANVTALAGYGPSENSFGVYDKPKFAYDPTPSHTQYQTPEVAEAAYPHSHTDPFPASALGNDLNSAFAAEARAAAEPTSFGRSTSRKLFKDNHATTRASHRSSPIYLNPTENVAKPAQGQTAILTPGKNNLLQNPGSVQKKTSPSQTVSPSVQCQWADRHGKPCGRIFNLGNDMHEHLKSVHSVKTSVFCQWLGCRFGVHSPSPHKYANSVERHTWGHSGYRPYKCSTCSEGFAAANVRDEHFANFHLKRKMFSCDICTHQCSSARNLKRHKDDTHQTERFQCEFCNRNGKVRLFPRASNLARHFRKCKFVLALFPDANGAATGKIDDDWFPTGYRGGHQGMDKAKVVPPNYLALPK